MRGRDRAISAQTVTLGTWVMRGPGELTHNCPKAGFLSPSPGMETDHGHPCVQPRETGRAEAASSAQLTSETDELPTSTAPAAFRTD